MAIADKIRSVVNPSQPVVVLSLCSFVTTCGPHNANVAFSTGEYFRVSAAQAAEWSKGGLVRRVTDDAELRLAELEIERRG